MARYWWNVGYYNTKTSAVKQAGRFTHDHPETSVSIERIKMFNGKVRWAVWYWIKKKSTKPMELWKYADKS